MGNVKVNVPKDVTVFETKIKRLRQAALWSRALCMIDVLFMGFAIVGMLTKSPSIVISDWTAVGTFALVFYAGYLIMDFLADLGQIVLSMKWETQYTSKVVKEVREGRR